MWGRLATCGRVALGLPTSMQMPTGPSTGCPLGAGPQDTILPHISHLATLGRCRSPFSVPATKLQINPSLSVRI